MLNLTNTESDRLAIIAKALSELALYHAGNRTRLTSEERSEIKQRIEALRAERKAIIRNAQARIECNIARLDQVCGDKKILTVSRLMKAGDLAESCREYRLMHRILNFKGA